MVSTRQMSITTVGPETGSSNGNASTSTNRFASNALNQQQNVSTRQQQIQTNALKVHVQDNAISGHSSTTSNVAFGSVPTNAAQLTDMPVEIFEKIFQYTGYKEVSNMRLVSTQMNQVCKTVLNSTFTKLQSQLMKRFQHIKKVMPRRESARRSHPSSYECDIIETCCMHLSLLQMTFGRYIEHKLICFFPGAFLDEVYNVLNYIRTTPIIGRPYKLTEELIDLSTMAMEYFKDHLEPTMPQFGLFSNDFYGKTSTTTRASPKKCYLFDKTASTSTSSVSISTRSSQSSSMPSPPQSNMVLRKGIRKIKQGMKKYNNQLSVLRTDLRFCKRKSTDQTKQITELQNMLSDQQKQTLEYANRLDEHDKKSEEMSRKISTLLQELNKCKIELHYYRSKSPATPFCNNCGQTTLTVPPGDLLELMQQNLSSRDDAIMFINKNMDADGQQSHESSMVDLITEPQLLATNSVILTDENGDSMAIKSSANTLTSKSEAQQMHKNGPTVVYDQHMKSISISSEINDKKRTVLVTSALPLNNTTPDSIQTASTSMQPPSIEPQSQPPKKLNQSSSVILTVGTPRFYGKRKSDDFTATPTADNSPTFSETESTNNMNISNNQLPTNNASMANNLSSKQSNVIATNNLANPNSNSNSNSNSNLSDNYGKKARRVQNKLKIQPNIMNIKTRNK